MKAKHSQKIQTWVTKEMAAAIKEEAKKLKISQADVIRTCIAMGLNL